MERVLLAGLQAAGLEAALGQQTGGPVALGQETGGPFKGSLAISRQAEGQCVDNRGRTIPEGRLFEPGQDQCQVRTFSLSPDERVLLWILSSDLSRTLQIPHCAMQSATESLPPEAA
jgi:hypothetical protein